MLLLTSWPRLPEVPYLSNVPNVDRFVHFGLYAVEGFLLYLGIAWPGRRRFSLARVAALAGLMAVWAVADEVHQAWIPGRSTEAGDVAADVLGATAGAAAASALVGRRRTGTLAETGRETIRPRAGG
ncbi:MAG: VanZ family protein [Acidobacteriota bacterium]